MALISTVTLRHSAATATTTIFCCRSLLFSSATTKPRQSSSWPYFRWNKKFLRPTTIHLESRETNCLSLTVLRNATAPSQTTLSHVSTQGQTSIKGSHSVGLKEENAVGSRDEGGGGSVDTSGGSKGKGEGGERGGGGGAGVGENDGETRPYTTIPGPKPLPLIGNKLLFTPLGGYSLEQFWATCWRLYREFGPIVRLSGVMGDSDLVMVFKPDDTRKIFQVEGTHPIRPALDVLAYYRQQRPEWYTSVGLVPGNGEEWYRLRAGVHSLLRRVVVTKYRLPQALVARDLVTHLTWKLGSPAGSRYLPSQNQVVEDVLPILFRYTLEAVGLVALGIRLGCLEKEGDLNKTTEDNKNENLHDAESIINANEEVLTALGESLFHPPFYKIFPTKIYKTVARGQDTIARVVKDELSRRKEERARFPEEFSEKHPFLESLLAKKDFTDSDIFLLLVEVFQGGIDATATTLAFCLYFIAKDPKVQETLYEEVKEVDLTSHSLQGLVYLRAVLQETMRLRPSASASTRLTQRDMVFSGYHVPAGTFVSSPPVVSCHDPNEFPEPDLFLPQRWLIRRRRQRGEQLPTMTPQGRDRQEGSVHPYAVLPFGHGARMCPGRRLAEQEVFLAIIQIVQYFKLESVSVTNETKTVGQVMRMNMMPDSAISIRFVPRS